MTLGDRLVTNLTRWQPSMYPILRNVPDTIHRNKTRSPARCCNPRRTSYSFDDDDGSILTCVPDATSRRCVTSQTYNNRRNKTSTLFPLQCDIIPTPGLTSMRAHHVRVPIAVLVLTNLSLSPLSRTHFRTRSPTRKKKKDLQTCWRMECDVDTLRHTPRTPRAIRKRHGSDRERRTPSSIMRK